MIKVDPQIYNLPSRVKLFEDTKKNIFISIDRKSRIIMKDGLRILEHGFWSHGMEVFLLPDCMVLTDLDANY